MKVASDKTKVGLMVVLLVLSTQAAVGQTPERLQPPRQNLVALHFPDLNPLEPDVRDHLSSLQTTLRERAGDPDTTTEELAEAYGGMAEIYHAYSLLAPAREAYTNAIALKPGRFRWHYLLGRLYQQENQLADALKHYQGALKVDPNYAALYVNLGNILLQLDRLEEAAANFQTSVQLKPHNPAALFGLGSIALARRNFAEAIKHFEQALTGAPGANRIHYGLAMAHRGLGDTEKAKQHLSQQGSVGVRPDDEIFDGLQDLVKGERLYILRGRLAFNAKRYEEAATEFRKAVAAKPDSLVGHLNLGAALTQTGDIAGAKKEFRESLRLDPTNMIAHFNLAVLLAQENQPAEAIKHLREFGEVDPSDVGARFLLAQQLLKLERWEEALKEFTWVVERDPQNEAALLEQVKLLARQNQHELAIKNLEQSHARFPYRGQTILMLARLLVSAPRNDLRNGTRALELAQLAFKASGQAEHGALVVLALAELGRCSEAAALQRDLIARAEATGKAELARTLQLDLKRFEKQPCRLP